MAQLVQIEAGTTAKRRNPWGVLGLTLITVGIYAIFWWYFVNRELRDLGRARDVDLGQSPATSVVAVTIGGLILVPPLVSFWKTGGRIARAQERTGISPSGTKPLFFVLMLFLGPIGLVYGQYQLNDIWDRVGDAREPSAHAAFGA